MKTKKIILFFSLFIIMIFFFTACGPKADDNVLNVWITWGDNPAQLQALFDRFGEENGVKVVVTAPVETDQNLPDLTGSRPPDVLILSGGDLVKSYAAEGLVMELSDAIIITLPIIIAFFFAQKTFIQGIKLTGQKE